jgi:uncharacterized membrane protein
MNLSLVLAIIIIGFATGLRSMTTPAVVAWAAHLGKLGLGATWLSFMASPITVGYFELFALGEFVADLLPGTPAPHSCYRTDRTIHHRNFLRSLSLSCYR